MRNIYIMKALIGLVVATLLVGTAAARTPVVTESLAGFRLPYLRSEQAVDMPLTGAYSGQVTLQAVYSGVFSETLQTRSFEGGNINLAFELEQVGTQVDGYIALEHTMVFTQEHTLNDQAMGPWVSGSFDGSTLDLASEKFYWELASGRVLPEDGRILLDKQAIRQFKLVTTKITNGGARLVGEYRETFWNLSPQPITLVGTFSLTRPVYQTIYNYEVYLPALRK